MAVAKTLQEILQHPIVSRALDRRNPIRELVEEALLMSRRDLFSRNPAQAYVEREDGVRVYQGTDFDLYTLLTHLTQRKAVINIPSYETLREHSFQSNRRVIANTNRHGQLLKLVSNKETHAFSVMIVDFNVAEIGQDDSEKVGVPRNFAVVDDSGRLYEGFSSLDWHETPQEKEFIEKKGLEAFRGDIKFKYFVQPALASSFHSAPYLVPKILDARIADEAAFYGSQAENLRRQGVKLQPPAEKVLYWKEGPTYPQKVLSLEARVILPSFRHKYPIYGIEEFGDGQAPRLKRYTGMPTTKSGQQEVLRHALWHLKNLRYRYGPRIRVHTRAVELAFFLYGFKDPENKMPGTEIKPGWDVPEWVPYVRVKPRGRILWNVLPINWDVQLLYRIREITVQRTLESMPMPYILNNSP